MCVQNARLKGSASQPPSIGRDIRVGSKRHMPGCVCLHRSLACLRCWLESTAKTPRIVSFPLGEQYSPQVESVTGLIGFKKCMERGTTQGLRGVQRQDGDCLRPVQVLLPRRGCCHLTATSANQRYRNRSFTPRAGEPLSALIHTGASFRVSECWAWRGWWQRGYTRTTRCGGEIFCA